MISYRSWELNLKHLFFFYFNDNECDAQLLVNAHIFLATKWNSKAAVMFDSDVNTVQVRLI